MQYILHFDNIVITSLHGLRAATKGDPRGYDNLIFLKRSIKLGHTPFGDVLYQKATF